MRIEPEQIKAIKRTVNEIVDKDSEVYLFGSRVDDTQRGGDINLLVEGREPADPDTRLNHRIALSQYARDSVSEDDQKNSNSFMMDILQEKRNVLTEAYATAKRKCAALLLWKNRSITTCREHRNMRSMIR